MQHTPTIRKSTALTHRLRIAAALFVGSAAFAGPSATTRIPTTISPAEQPWCCEEADWFEAEQRWVCDACEWLRNKGDPQPPLSGSMWDRFEIDNSFLGAEGIRIGDVNNNGLLDFAVSWEQSGVSVVYLNPGPWGVTQHWPSVVVGSTPNAEDAFFVDLDGDGVLDVVSCLESPTHKIRFHWGPATPQQYMESSEWLTVQVPSPVNQPWMFGIPMQIDGLHGVDLVIGAKRRNTATIGPVGWLRAPENPRDVGAWTYHKIMDVGWTMNIIAADMDNDGETDIVVSDRLGTVRGVNWCKNPGAGAPEQLLPWEVFTIPQTFFRPAMQIELTDLDGDGLIDIVVPYRNGSYMDQASTPWLAWLRRLDDTGYNWEQYHINLPKRMAIPKAVTVADIDKDGFPDIVLTLVEAEGDFSGVVWLRNPGDPTSPDWEVFELSGPDGVKYDLVYAVDLNNNGYLDIVTTDENDNAAGPALGVVWYRNPFGPDPLPGDTNGDGVVDFADFSNVLSGFGSSGWGLPGDLNGDGVVDFADFSIVLQQYGETRAGGDRR